MEVAALESMQMEALHWNASCDTASDNSKDSVTKIRTSR